VAAVAVAFVMHGALVRMMSESDSDFHVAFVLDPAVLAFVLLATVAATLLFGVLPAWQVTKTDVGATLREQSRGALGRFGQLRSGRYLVSLQLALSLPLLVGAGLLARTVYNLQHADLGFPAERLLLVRVDLREARYETARRDGVLRELLEAIQRIPGVRKASFSQLGIFTGGESSATIDVEGYVAKGHDDRESALDVVGPGYFSTLSVAITLGREIREDDRPDVCVINEAFARRFFEGRNPIGRRVTLVNDDARSSYQVVGVASDARTQRLRGEIEPRFFVPTKGPSSSASSPTFLIRTEAETAVVLAAVRKTIQAVDAALPIMSATSIQAQMAPLTAQDRTTATLAVVFGSVALTLAAIGLYGVLSYGISRRTSEIAIRIALGAQTGRVIAMILRETIGVVAVGLGLGGALAFTASRLIDSRLYGVAPQDPLTLASSTALLVVVAIRAALLPARRASRLDPMAALRSM
jgi:predicted permease